MSLKYLKVKIMKSKQFLKRIYQKISKFLCTLYTHKCGKCKTGRIRYIGEEWIGSSWINVYECDTCGNKYI